MIDLDEFEQAVRREERMRLNPNVHTGYLHANRIATERAREKVEEALAELPAPPELEEAIKHVTAYDSAQVGMLEYTKLWRLVVAARHYLWMLQRVEQLAAESRAPLDVLKAMREAWPEQPISAWFGTINAAIAKAEDDASKTDTVVE